MNDKILKGEVMMKKNELNVLWTTKDPVTSEHFLFLYTVNAKKRGWFDQVNIIVWGASASLIAENKTIQSLIAGAMREGIKIRGCLHCAKSLGVEKKLRDIGIELIYMGEPLTELIKSGGYVITV